MKKVLKSFFIFFIRDIFLEAGGNISQTFGPRNELVPIPREILFVKMIEKEFRPIPRSLLRITRAFVRTYETKERREMRRRSVGERCN